MLNMHGLGSTDRNFSIVRRISLPVLTNTYFLIIIIHLLNSFIHLGYASLHLLDPCYCQTYRYMVSLENDLFLFPNIPTMANALLTLLVHIPVDQRMLGLCACLDILQLRGASQSIRDITHFHFKMVDSPLLLNPDPSPYPIMPPPRPPRFI
jgi:hypothetical protein